MEITKAVVRMCSVKTVFLEISQNSQENTCARDSFLIKLQTQHKCFPINIAKFLRTAFFIEHLRKLIFKAMFETCQNFTMKNKKGFY